MCNSRCRYCYEKSMCEWNNGLEEKWEFDFSVPAEFNVNVSKLKSFLDKDEEPCLIFYGGEPLLKWKKIVEIMDSLGSRVKYYMQTNGKLLNLLPKEYMNKFSKILVSIDGDKERTDYNRGNNSYDIILKKVKEIRENGFEGEIVARMTISFPDVYVQVLHLTKLIEQGIFDSVHWQLDAGFYKNDFDFEKFNVFVKEYNNEIKILIDFWVEEMGNGKVWKFYPFVGIMNSLLNEEKTRLRCGSGFVNYTITTDGKIAACPIMNNVKEFYSGDLDSDLKQLRTFDVGEPCDSCDYLDVCGGRCLYWNQAKLWPSEGDELICKTIKFLIDSLRERVLEVRNLITEGIILEEDFEYEKYFGPEIIP